MDARLARLTPQQRKAVTGQGVSVALSAGAGCGKTRVLVERYLAELDRPAPRRQGDSATAPSGRAARLGRLVAITFTERAAREMRDRVRQAAREQLQGCGPHEAADWLELVRRLDTARISTIHSFCASLLRTYAVELGIDPEFRLLDEAQANLLIRQLVEDQLRQLLAASDAATLDLVLQFGLERLMEMGIVFLEQRDSIDWDRWCGMSARQLVESWRQFWRRTMRGELIQQILQWPPVRQLQRIVAESPPIHPNMQTRCAALQAALDRLPTCGQLGEVLKEIQQTATVQHVPKNKAWPDQTVFEQFKQAAKAVREQIDRQWAALAALDQTDEQTGLPAAEIALGVLRFARRVVDQYEKEKRQQALLDFTDLLAKTRQLLCRPEHQDACREAIEQIDLILVDEFQDTDPVQVAVIEALCGSDLTAGKLFFVGDYKQSIYRFRGADPHVFRRLSNQVPAEGRLPLSVNFRSQPAILHFVNALFCEVLGPRYEPLEAQRSQVSPIPAVEFLWACVKAEEGERVLADELRRAEAERIARRLRRMLDEAEPLVGASPEQQVEGSPVRAVRPGDIAILFRALSNVQLYEEALRRYGIPYYLVGGHAFYAQQEIFDLLNLLRSLANRCDEVSLAGVLRSPMFGLTDETLYWLARRPEGLSAGLFAHRIPENLDSDQRARAEFARKTLAQLAALKDRLPVAELIQEAVARTGYDAVLLGEFLGERKLANLHKLVEQARSFDASGMFGLSDFIAQLSEFVADQPREPLAATYPESADVVRLMTIHQAKGLEFPVVIVADMARESPYRSESAVFHPELGPAVKTEECFGYALFRHLDQAEDRAEATRLLYVATTRAADQLILSAGLGSKQVDSIGSGKSPWFDLLCERFDWETGRFCGRLPGGWSVPAVRVAGEELLAQPSSGTRWRGRAPGKVAGQLAAARPAFPEQLARCLPVAPDRAAQQRFSFSSLTGELVPHRPAVAPPENAGQEDESRSLVDARGLGSLVHDVLARIDFCHPEDTARWVERLAPRHLNPPPESPHEIVSMITRFLHSARARQISASETVYRELEFLLAWPPDAENHGRYLQGFIDCLYEEGPGRWTVLDYKTNDVAAEQVAQAAAAYEMQMLLYALAVERVVGAAPSELALCFLRPGVEHRFAWNDQARARIVTLIDGALERCLSG